jgi:tetratricopeptide (TPR) repeat protein
VSQAARPPEGDLYDWYRRGLALLEAGDAAAAAQVLVHAVSADSESASLREALGRARLGAKQYELAREDFEYLVATRPDDDFAHFGLGLALSRLGLWSAAVEQLALACALRPERADYQRELTHARATVQSRQAARRTGGQP